MMQGQASLVSGGQYKGGAAHVSGHSQPLSDALGQTGLPRSQGTGQQENVSGQGLFANTPAHLLGLFRSGGDDFRGEWHPLPEVVPTGAGRRPFGPIDI